MSSKTPNFNLHKIDLTDAPPDITVLNQNWDILDAELENARNSVTNKVIPVTSTDGVSYTGEVEGITKFYDGLSIRILPNIVSSTTSPTLNINNLGAVRIAMLSTLNNSEVVSPTLDSWLSAMRPVNVTLHQVRSSSTGAVINKYWIVDWRSPSANSLYGTVPIASGGTGATDAETARKNLGTASTETITVSVGTSWTKDTTNGGYYQTCTATSMKAGDNPVVDVILGDDIAANALYKEAWACVDRVVTAADSVTVYANEKAPTTAFTFQAKVVR